MMYVYKKYMRLIVMTSSVIAYSCYISCQNGNIQEEHSIYSEGIFDNQSVDGETKMFNFLICEYASMLNQGMHSERVHELIQERFKEKPEFGDKLWDKVQIFAAQSQSEAFHAFSEKK